MPRPPEPGSLAAFVEEMGDLFDRTGSPRIAGRVVGWLLVADPPHQSAAQIQEAIGASKGSVSTVTRQLLGAGLLERLGMPGDRRTYYRIRAGGWASVLGAKLRFTHAFAALADRWRGRLGSDPSRVQRLADMERFYRLVGEAVDTALDRWRSGADRA